MCRQEWSHNRGREGLIPFKKTQIHNEGLPSCMEKWLCSNWMDDKSHPSLDDFLRMWFNVRQPTGCGAFLSQESLRSRGIRPRAPLQVLLTIGLLSSPQAPTYPGAPHPGKASHKRPRAKGRSRDEFFHKLRWQFMPGSKRTDKPHNLTTGIIPVQVPNPTLALKLFVSMSHSKKFHRLIRCHFKVYCLLNASRTHPSFYHVEEINGNVQLITPQSALILGWELAR